MSYNYPYGMPYPSYIPQQNQQPQLNQFAFVNGLEGAKAYQIMPNQTMMLMDSENPIVFKKTADAYGRASLSYYKLVEIKEDDLKAKPQVNPEYALKEDLDTLRQKLDEISSKLQDKEE